MGKEAAPISLDYETPPPVRYVEPEVFLFQCVQGGPVHALAVEPNARPACAFGCGAMQLVGHCTPARPHA